MGGKSGGDNEIEPTEEEKALANIAVDRWNDYESRIKPYENEFMAEVQMTPGDYQKARGDAVTATEQSFADERADLSENLFAKQGVAPGSGSHAMQTGGMAQDQAEVAGVGAGEAHTATQAQHMAGLQSIVDMGQGQASEAKSGLGSVAQGAAQDAQHRASMAADQRQSTRKAVGSALGAGTAYYMNKDGSGLSGSWDAPPDDGLRGG